MTIEATGPGFPLTVTTEATGDAVVVHLSGELDVHTVRLLRDAVPSEAADLPARLVLDLTGLTFIDSSGLGVIIAVHKQTRTVGCVFGLVAVGGPVLRMLDITGTRSVLNLHPSVADALADTGA